MPPNTTARNAVRGAPVGGANGYIRRLLFPDLPPTKCIDGLIFFPWGTGPFWPIPCDEGVLLPHPGPIGSQFLRKPSSAFVNAVAELAAISPAKASKVVAAAAGVTPAGLAKLATGEVARAIFANTAGKLDVMKERSAAPA